MIYKILYVNVIDFKIIGFVGIVIGIEILD